MARANLELVPDRRRATARSIGVVTERALARRYIRESRDTLHARATRRPTCTRSSRCSRASCCRRGSAARPGGSGSTRWTLERPSGISEGDVVVVGNRDDAQQLVIELGAALLVALQRRAPDRRVLELAREHGTAVIVSPLDTYVSGRMITLAAPCRALMEPDPLTARPTTCSRTSPSRSRRSTTAPRSSVDAQRQPARAGHALGPGRAAAPARDPRRPCRAGTERRRESSRPRSSRSSTTTTSARSRRASR